MSIVRKLVSPFKGVLIPIEKVPDPVFAEKMVGDGVSVDPLEGILRAPCDGDIVHLHDSCHAVTIKTADEVEIVLHIGLDTVMLKGEGFTPKVKSGDKVKTGDTLIEFDMRVVASKAPHLLTQIIISTMDKVANLSPVDVVEVKAGDDLFTYEVTAAGGTEDTATGTVVESEPIYLPNPVGLHARPAAVLAKMVSEYSSKVELRLGDKTANARSVTSLMKLNSAYGDEVVLVAQGDDAEEVIAKVAPEIKAGLGEEGVKPLSGPLAKAVEQKNVPEVVENESGEIPGILAGVSASAGLAVGNLFKLKEEVFDIPESGQGYDGEKKTVNQAIGFSKEKLKELHDALDAQDPGQAAIFMAHQELLEDPDLLEAVDVRLKKNESAAKAWKESFEEQAAELAELKSQVLAERANDMRDVGKRVLRAILGIEESDMSFPENTILAAEELTPSITASLDRSKVLGFCTVGGGATSHVAILARAMGIPAVVGVDKRILQLEDGVTVVVDGSAGSVKLSPDAAEIDRIKLVQEKTASRKAEELKTAKEQARTKDGHHLEVVGNVGNPDESKEILNLGGEGVGLLRSEFLFQERMEAPSEDEQFEAYKTVIEAVGAESNVVIRTLDVGGDKPLAYLPLPKEENPFLGERGIRVGLNRPELLRTQLRALLKAGKYGKLNIMFPMISDIEEFRKAKAILEEERVALGAEPVGVGIMIEVPAAAVMAEVFAKEVDFFSVGTNDLTQYTMAMDRGHPKLAAQADGLHPAVLRMIKMTVDAAHAEGKWVGVCGGLAGDPQAVPVLVGLGVDELSVSIPAIPSVKAQIRTLNLSDAKVLAEKAISASTASEVRELSPNPYSDELL